MPSFAQRVLSHIRRQELLGVGERVGVAVSGGIDSVALLRLLLELRGELGIVLAVVHFNHKLRGEESEADQEFVAGFARELGLEFYWGGQDTARHAADRHCSIEAAARELRYEFFHSLLGAHTDPLGNKAPFDGRGQGSTAPPQGDDPQELTPASLFSSGGTSELGPLPNRASLNPAIPQPHHLPLNPLTKICTGHTLDDQAETVLMRVIRGTGLRGLGAIHPRLLVEDETGGTIGEIVRPLLGFRRRELEEYLRELSQLCREDASNASDRFTRNRVRHNLLPLIEREFNPSITENLAELSEIARGEEDYWENEAAGWIGRTIQWFEPEWVGEGSPENLVQIQLASSNASPESRIEEAPWLVVNGLVNRLWLLAEPIAVQRRVIKAMGEHVRLPLEFKHVEEVLRFAAEEGDSGKELSLPYGWKMVRHPEELTLVTPDLRQSDDPSAFSNDYEYDLPVPGSVLVAEVRSMFETQTVSAAVDAHHRLEGERLAPASLAGPLRVRNWRPGDRFWPAHTKSPKKIKELLQGRSLGPIERKLWPVITSGDVIVWVRGFPLPERFQAKPSREAVLIVERRFDG